MPDSGLRRNDEKIHRAWKMARGPLTPPIGLLNQCPFRDSTRILAAAEATASGYGLIAHAISPAH